jgi:hypothetical protein
MPWCILKVVVDSKSRLPLERMPAIAMPQAAFDGRH